MRSLKKWPHFPNRKKRGAFRSNVMSDLWINIDKPLLTKAECLRPKGNEKKKKRENFKIKSKKEAFANKSRTFFESEYNVFWRYDRLCIFLTPPTKVHRWDLGRSRWRIATVRPTPVSVHTGHAIVRTPPSSFFFFFFFGLTHGHFFLSPFYIMKSFTIEKKRGSIAMRNIKNEVNMKLKKFL